jgi:broad specificity phosphatase PhoE
MQMVGVYLVVERRIQEPGRSWISERAMPALRSHNAVRPEVERKRGQNSAQIYHAGRGWGLVNPLYFGPRPGHTAARDRRSINQSLSELQGAEARHRMCDFALCDHILVPTVDIRRHSYTKKGVLRGRGSHLSQEGIDLAQRIGERSGPYDRVLTSRIPRTFETAIAMGFAVDDQLESLGDIPAEAQQEIGHHERWSWEEPFVQFARLVEQGGPTAQMARQQVQVWTEALRSVPQHGRVLIISHGRVIETGLVAAVPTGDYRGWGKPFHHCEGVRLTYADGVFSVEQFLRVEAPTSQARDGGAPGHR